MVNSLLSSKADLENVKLKNISDTFDNFLTGEVYTIHHPDYPNIEFLSYEVKEGETDWVAYKEKYLKHIKDMMNMSQHMQLTEVVDEKVIDTFKGWINKSSYPTTMTNSVCDNSPENVLIKKNRKERRRDKALHKFRG